MCSITLFDIVNEMHLFVELPGLACESNPCQNGGSCIPQGFQHKCICPDGFGGFNCQFPGCGGNVTSEETLQQISVPNVTDTVNGCLWTIHSPVDSRINLHIEETRCYYRFDTHVTVWSG